MSVSEKERLLLRNTMSIEEIEAWLREGNTQKLQTLWQWADDTRKKFVGDEVHLRGLIEISNYCCRQCAYCGLRAGNMALKRYRMHTEEILACAHQAVEFGYGTVVLQSGEDYGIEREWLANIIRRIKQETPLAVTLSLGERPDDDLRAWREAGADRYLLRFETSDEELYHQIHPQGPYPRRGNRIEILQFLRKLGYEIGSGIMIGIPGQTFSSLARDIDLFRQLDLDMIGVGPYIPHPQTPLGTNPEQLLVLPEDQVPNTELMTYKVIALARLVCPYANIPSTTALATLNRASGRELGLQRGANIVMPNITPIQYRVNYEIYPAKVCIEETAEQCHACIRARILSIGRTIGKGPGGRKRSSHLISPEDKDE